MEGRVPQGARPFYSQGCGVEEPVSAPRLHRRSLERGFTLRELLIVMVIVGIISAIALTRTGNDPVMLSTQVDQLAGDIRYVQALAMTQGQRYRINLTATGYTLTLANAGGTLVPHPLTGSTAQPDGGPAYTGDAARAGAHGADPRSAGQSARGPGFQQHRGPRSLQRGSAHCLHDHLRLYRDVSGHGARGSGCLAPQSGYCQLQARHRHGDPGWHHTRPAKRSAFELLAMIRRSTAFRFAGFTLIEVVITLIVLGVLATIGATVMSRGFLSYFVGREIARDDAQGRLAFERMARELRTVRSTADLNIGVANQITITDFDQNVIVYRRNAGTSQLERSQDNGVTFQPLADNVSALTIDRKSVV